MKIEELKNIVTRMSIVATGLPQEQAEGHFAHIIDFYRHCKRKPGAGSEAIQFCEGWLATYGADFRMRDLRL
jgi:hypothetical protein